jgi:hypothetical protein
VKIQLNILRIETEISARQANYLSLQDEANKYLRQAF